MCLHRKITLRKSGVKISNPFVKKTVTGSMPTLQCFSTSLAMGSNIYFCFYIKFGTFLWILPKSSHLKVIYSEKATKFCKIATVDLTVTTYLGQIEGGGFAKFCDLLRIYEL